MNPYFYPNKRIRIVEQHLAEALQNPTVQDRLDELKDLDAPVGQITEQAVNHARNEGAVSKGQAVQLILSFLLDKINEWEAKRTPKTAVGRFIKNFIGLFQKPH